MNATLSKRHLLARLLRDEANPDAGAGDGDPAPAPADGGAPAPAPATKEPPATPAWHDSIQDEGLKAFITGKGFKDAAEAAKALQELEGKTAAPESPDAYALQVPEGQDAAFATEAAKWMHEAGIPVAQAQVLAAKWNEYQAQQAQAWQQQRQQQGEADLTALRKEWGPKYDENVELGRRAVRTFGVDADTVEKMSTALGDAATMRLFQRIGQYLGEASLTPEGGNGQPQGGQKTMEELFYPTMTKG